MFCQKQLLAPRSLLTGDKVKGCLETSPGGSQEETTRGRGKRKLTGAGEQEAWRDVMD